MQKRFYTADAMRGVAALIVVFYHAQTVMAPGGWSPRYGFLAVDLFFVLSGFVIAHSYDDRLAAGLDTKTFMKARAIRLMPLLWAGLTIGVVTALVNGDVSDLRSLVPSAVILPTPGRFDQFLFPLDPPAWSLLFEFWIANLFYAASWRWLQGRSLMFFIGLSLLGLLWSVKTNDGLNTGFGWYTAMGGFWRVLFSFFVGVWLARVRRLRQPVPVPSLLVLALAALSLAAPIGPPLHHKYQVLCVVLLFPCLVFLSSGVLEEHSRFSEVLGDASYAAYTIHFPLAGLFLAIAPSVAHHIWARVAFVLVIAVLALLLDSVDRPVRKAITRAI